MKPRKAVLALAVTAVLGMGAAGQAHGALPLVSYDPVLTWGGPTFVKFIGFDAVLRSEMWFFATINPGPNQNPLGGDYLFANKNPAAAHTGDPQPMANKFAWHQIGLGWAPNTELHFGLFVQGLLTAPPPGQSANVWFFTGDESYNPDNRIHAKVTELGKYHYAVGFEDLCKREHVPPGLDCTSGRFPADWDYNDHVFEIYSTPEPLTMTLMGTGLLGLAGVARRRRRKLEDAEL
jgi:MYXO-CTERM domain-containing protein